MSIRNEEAQKRVLQTLEYTLGHDIMEYLKDPDVVEIIVNPDTKLWVDTRSKGRIDTGNKILPETSQQVIFQIASMKNTICSAENPTLATELPDGSRFQGFLPNVVKAPSFIIRKHTQRHLTLQDYVDDGIMTAKQREVILQAIRDHRNIVAAGGTKSGKTTLLNAILSEISKCHERIVMIEDTQELQCTAEDHLDLKVTNQRSMSALLKDTLRSTPERIVVGEVRGEEALALLDAWNTGHDGGCSTVHSSSAYLTLNRLEQLVSRVSITPQQETIAGAVNVIVYLRRRGTSRYIEEILSVDGYDAEKRQYLTHKLA